MRPTRSVTPATTHAVATFSNITARGFCRRTYPRLASMSANDSTSFARLLSRFAPECAQHEAVCTNRSTDGALSAPSARASLWQASSVSPRGPHDASSAFRIGVFSPRLSRSSDAWLKARGVHQPPHECGIRAAAAAWPLLHDAALCFSRTAPRVRPPTSPARLRRATGSCTSLRSAWLSCLSRSDRCARSCPRGAR